jgi:hypothetical protein
MASISRALARVKQDLRTYLPDSIIEQVCRDAGHRYRQRVLAPPMLLHLFVLQVLCFNTAITHLRHLGHMSVSAAAYCKARTRLPLAVVQTLLRITADQMMVRADQWGQIGWESGRRWCGLRPHLVDGSSTITPDTPALDKHFGHPSGQKKGCGFPVPRILGLFDAWSGLIVEALCLPLWVHEMSQVWRVHPLLGQGDLLVGDRGFCSYAHLALLNARGVAGLFRLHHRRPEVDFRCGRRVQRLGRDDRIVRWTKPPMHQKPRWMSDDQYALLPATLDVRLVRYQTPPANGRRTREVTVVTTLLDPRAYPADKIAELYGVRWRVETHFAQLKTTLKMRRLKCKTVEGVQKELAAYFLVYNLVHMVMLEAAWRQNVTPDRISFIDAVRWLLSAAPGEALVALIVNPRRPGRHEPRVIKDLQDTYRKMTRSRAYLKRHLELTRR